MTTNKVAYLITYISYSCIYNHRGIINEELLEQYLLNEVSEYIINNSCSTKFEFIDDIKKFWERYGGYNVWEAYCVKNNDWINVTPKDEDILLNINEMTKSFEIFEEIFLQESLEEIILEKTLNIDENEDEIEYINKDEDEIEYIDKNECIDENKNKDEIEIELSISSNDSFSEILYGEDIEIDWNTISNQEREEQEENLKK